MNLYEENIRKELDKWHRNMQKPPSYFNKVTKKIQTKTQNIIPDKVQDIITESIKKMTQSIMYGSSVLTNMEVKESLLLSESDWLVEKAYKNYNKIAVAQGIGFGAGGIIMALADFPALLSVKVKFLFDCAKLYGYDVDEKSERLYLLYIFQLAFSSDEHRLKVYNIITNWDCEGMKVKDINWEKFQIEYRDYIDIAKLLQLLPVVGAVVGGVANYKLLEKLKITAMNCYRNRYINDHR